MKTNSRNTFAATLAMSGLAAAFITAQAEINPLQFPSYLQTVTVEFPDAQKARDAQLSLSPLPGGAETAYSCRWDDSTDAHIKKSAMMAEVGVKGSFYLNDRGRFAELRARTLMDAGHAIGNHTVAHRHMGQISSDAAFREIMEQRIRLEKAIGRTVTSYVSPYGWSGVSGKGEQAVKSLRHMRSVLDSVVYGGHFVSQDSAPGWCELDSSTWMWTNRFNADDRHPSRDKFVAGFKAAKEKASRPGGIPRVTLGTHSWCNDEGTANQGRWLKEFFFSPGAVQMNDWEYGAYRYSYLHGSARKVGVKGTVATFEVVRYSPAFLGDMIPLSITFSEAPVSVKAASTAAVAKGANGTWTLPHDSAHRMAGEISGAFNGLDVAVEPDETAGKLSVTLRNATGGELSDVTVVAVLPPKWNRRRFVEHCGKIAGGATRRIECDCGGASGLVSEDDASYYPVSIDFSSGGVQRRVWRTTREAK